MKRKNRRNGPEQGSSAGEEALKRFQPLLSPTDYARLMDELQRPLSPALRLNPLKVQDSRDLANWAQRYGWETKPVPYCSTGYWIPQSTTPISRTSEHNLGFYYIQDAASMLPVELFHFSESSRPLVLDLAASPGGKTTHLIDRSADLGLVIANDASQERIMALRLVLQTWGAVNQAVTNFPGEKFGLWFPGVFDRVLLDAPCSMQNLRGNESHPMRPISDKERQGLAARQKRLLASAFLALKTGGEVVYSTCTLNPEEDEAVVDDLLKRYPGQVEVIDLQKSLSQPCPGLQDLNGRPFDPSVKGVARLWPHCFGTSGFFSALLHKTDSAPLNQLAAPRRPLSLLGLERLNRLSQSALLAQIHERYGLDLAPLLERQDAVIWKRRSVIYLIPQSWMQTFSELPFQSVGMMLGEENEGLFYPSHDFVARFGLSCTAGKVLLDESQATAWMHGEDILAGYSDIAPSGSIVVVAAASGRLLGRGRVLSNSLKNLLPRRLVLS